MLDIRNAQTSLENVLRDTLLYAFGKRIPAVGSVGTLRTVASAGATSTAFNDDDLAVIIVGGMVTASYRWSTISTAADNGTTVIKPTDGLVSGRWLQWTSPLRLAPIVGGNSYYLHELAKEVQGNTIGAVQKVIVLDRTMTQQEMENLIFAAPPSIMIEVTGDDPLDLDQNVGFRWQTTFNVTIDVVAQNLRDRRQAAQGSVVANDPILGANGIDGQIQGLLAGTGLFAVESGIKAIRVGSGSNSYSTEGQRRVVRSRLFKIQTTVINPAAPNDFGAIDRISVQPEMTDLGEHTTYNDSNYVTAGMGVPLVSGLTAHINSGAAVIAGSSVVYAGENITLSASSDVYRDLLPNGTMVFVTVAAGLPEPVVTATALRIGITRTDTNDVVFDKYLAEIRIPYGDTYIYPF